jgi:hypothetical protein
MVLPTIHSIYDMVKDKELRNQSPVPPLWLPKNQCTVHHPQAILPMHYCFLFIHSSNASQHKKKRKEKNDSNCRITIIASIIFLILFKF